MCRETFFLPRSLNNRSVFGFISDLENARDCSEFVFNFKQLLDVEPFAMLIASAAIRKFKATKGKGKSYLAVGVKASSYAAYMGFYQSFGLPFGSTSGRNGSDTHIPISFIEVKTLEDLSEAENTAVGNIIEAKTIDIAKILTQENEGDLFDTVQYSLREIFRNVQEHSQVERIWYAAQYWATKKKVEIAVLDEGVGIRESLSKNSHLQLEDDESALNLAIQPGISGTAYRIGRTKRYSVSTRDMWTNSGYGLHMTSRFCQNSGGFTICSGRTALELQTDTDQKIIDTLFSGTALRIMLNTSKLSSLSATLVKFKKEGKTAINPSKASLKSYVGDKYRDDGKS